MNDHKSDFRSCSNCGKQYDHSQVRLSENIDEKNAALLRQYPLGICELCLTKLSEDSIQVMQSEQPNKPKLSATTICGMSIVAPILVFLPLAFLILLFLSGGEGSLVLFGVIVTIGAYIFGISVLLILCCLIGGCRARSKGQHDSARLLFKSGINAIMGIAGIFVFLFFFHLLLR